MLSRAAHLSFHLVFIYLFVSQTAELATGREMGNAEHPLSAEPLMGDTH